MRKHPEYGAEFVRRIPFLQGAAEIIANHHERFDGTGYPRRLSGDEIPISARVFTIVDAFDAIVSKRCYKEALPPEFALAEIRRCSGTQFDPKVVEAFERLYPRIVAAGLPGHAPYENGSAERTFDPAGFVEGVGANTTAAAAVARPA
jgi:HD-GYP domain-containing protein (c-di-GMP phosphodiesterase class II)